MTAMSEIEVVRAACCIAGIDGRVDPDERRLLQVIAKKIGVGTASLDAMIERAETEPDYHEQQFRVLKADPEGTIKLLFAVSLVDGKLGADERTILKRLADRLELPAERFEYILAGSENYLRNQADAGPAG